MAKTKGTKGKTMIAKTIPTTEKTKNRTTRPSAIKTVMN
jgi:hypothetical protein